MAMTKEFVEAVENGKLLRVRIMLKDILLIDPTAEKFDEMENFANAKLAGLYDEHDEEKLNYDAAYWNEDYLNKQMVNVLNNFSRERVKLLKNMVRHIYANKVQRIRSEKSFSRNQERRALTQKQVGVGTSVAGAALAVAGIVTSHTILTIGGAAVAAVGVALIITDKR